MLGAWTAFTKPHCHTNCHECYGVYSGSSTLILGRGPYDTKEDGIEIKMEKGDVLILPAGISHSSNELNKEYKFIGVYPSVRSSMALTLAILITDCRMDQSMKWTSVAIHHKLWVWLKCVKLSNHPLPTQSSAKTAHWWTYGRRPRYKLYVNG